MRSMLLTIMLVPSLCCAVANADSLTPTNLYAPYTVTEGKDTGVRQAEVLTKINLALSRGSITAEQASDYKAELNSINQKESWHKSYGEANPSDLLKEDEQRLATLSSKLDSLPSVHAPAKPIDAVHVDVHKLITDALGANKINIAQAEEYYARLAQIEADIESLQNDPVKSSEQAAVLNQSLKQLKQEVEKKH